MDHEQLSLTAEWVDLSARRRSTAGCAWRTCSALPTSGAAVIAKINRIEKKTETAVTAAKIVGFKAEEAGKPKEGL